MNPFPPEPGSFLEVASALANGAQVLLLLDACSLLDVVRAPLDGGTALVSAALRVRESTGTGVAPVLSATAAREWAANREQVAAETRRQLAQTERTYRFALGALGALAGAPSGAKVDLRGLVTDLLALAGDIAAQTTVLPIDDSALLRAARRVQRGEPPSRRGRDEMLDCDVLEHYLELARATPLARHLFVSSNRKDFGDPRNLHPTLEGDFRSAGITYVSDLAWAVAVLDDPGAAPYPP